MVHRSAPQLKAPHTSATKLFPAAPLSSRYDNQQYRRRVWTLRTLQPAIQSSSVVHRVTEIHKKSSHNVERNVPTSTAHRPARTGVRRSRARYISRAYATQCHTNNVQGRSQACSLPTTAQPSFDSTARLLTNLARPATSSRVARPVYV